MDTPRDYIQIPVPEEHYSSVISLLAELDRDPAQAQPAPQKPPELSATLVYRMYWDSENRHRRLLELLAAHPEEWFFTSELAKALDVPTGTKGMAGVFGAFGRRAKHRYEGAKPWEMAWDSGREEARYRMTEDVAKWVKEVAE